jgi:hypothetical protein
MKTKIQQVKYMAVLMVAMCLLSGCCTILTKSKYSLMVDSNPDGAQLTITDKKGREVYNGNTPASPELKASSGFFSGARYLLRFSYPGHADYTVTVSSKLKGWYFGNLFIGGWLGLILDPATGAMWKLDRKYVNVVLTPLESDSQELKIYNINEIPEEWKSHLVAVN